MDSIQLNPNKTYSKSAPIRARTLPCLHSGGCASKQAALRLLSGALPGETRPFRNGDKVQKRFKVQNLNSESFWALKTFEC